MPGKEYSPRTDQQRADRQKAVEAKPTSAIESITSEDDFKRYLDVQARFHTYSAKNAALILLQRPDATKVAGIHAWNTLGRFVNKGERGIDIYAPVFAKGTKKEDEAKETPVVYVLVKVFAYEQTNGEPLPEFTVPELIGEELARYYRTVVSSAAFTHGDSHLYAHLRHWASSRHPNKGAAGWSGGTGGCSPAGTSS